MDDTLPPQLLQPPKPILLPFPPINQALFVVPAPVEEERGKAVVRGVPDDEGADHQHHAGNHVLLRAAGLEAAAEQVELAV